MACEITIRPKQQHQQLAVCLFVSGFVHARAEKALSERSSPTGVLQLYDSSTQTDHFAVSLRIKLILSGYVFELRSIYL